MFLFRSHAAMPPRGPASVLLYILHSGNLYGTERMALATIEGMAEYKERIVFAPPAGGRGSVLAAAQNAGLRTVSFMSRLGLLWHLLPWFIRHRSIDVIGTGVVHSLACHYLSRAFGVRLRQLHVAHGGTPTSLDQKHALNRIPCTLVAVSEFVRDTLIQRGVLAEKITVIENFLGSLDTKTTFVRPSYDATLPGARLVDRGRVRVAIVSRVDAFKRVDLLLGSDLPAQFPDFEFDVYGTGDQFDLLKERTAATPNVHLHGFVPDVVQRLADADVLLHLCPEEPFGLVVLEAFRARLVVVGPDSGGIGQLIDDGVTGLRFKANDAADLGRVFLELRAMDGAQMQRIADAGASKLRDEFNQARGVNRYRSALAASELAERLTTQPPLTASAAERPEILCVMRVPPDPNGHGASQRAWRVLRALRQHGNVHFVMIHREDDRDCTRASLQRLDALTASVTRIQIPEWETSKQVRFGMIPATVRDLVTIGSQDAPNFSPTTLDWIAERLPCHEADIVFAGRLSCAKVVQALMSRKRLSARSCVVDYDDIATGRPRHVHADGASAGPFERALESMEARLVTRSLDAIARRWDVVTLSSKAAAEGLGARHRDRAVMPLQNAVSRRRLAWREPDGSFRILCTANLGLRSNVAGIRAFVEDAWPVLSAAVPEARLAIVGVNPGPQLVNLARENGFELHGDVPSLEPHYEDCDVVIAPILDASGTRVRVLEALAYGRPVVATRAGVDGLEVEDGRHLLVADPVAQFAELLIALATDPARRLALANEGYAYQQAKHTPEVFNAALAAVLERAKAMAGVHF